MNQTLFGFYRETLRRHWKYAAGLFLLHVIRRTVNVAFFTFVIGMIYGLLETPDPWGGAGRVLAIAAEIQLGRFMLIFGGQIFENRLRPKVSADIAADLTARVFGNDWDFFISKNVGTIQSQIQKIRDGFHLLTIDFFSNVIGVVLGFIVIAGLLFEIDTILAAIIIGNGAIQFLWRILMMRRSARLSAEVSKSGSNVSGKVSDAIANWQNVKIFSGAERELEIETEARAEWQKKNWCFRRFTIANGMCKWMTDVLLFWTASLGYRIWLFAHGRMNVAGFAMAETAFGKFENEFATLGDLIKEANEARADAGQAWDEIMVPARVVDQKGAKDLVIRRGKIEIDSIDFSYGKSRLFRDFSLSIKPGESVGIIGESGAGKTTLSALLLRLFDVKKGRILIDGQDIKKVRQETLRDQIAFVPQDCVLFNRTIRDNIAYARPDATDDEIIRAAKAANIHDFIMTTPKGYDTMVGNRGIKLSGGQRQRIAIARAVLKNARILILDEATSSLDSATEAEIQKSLDALIRWRTTIAIAHRLSTLAKMDRIVVIAGGKIERQGTPKKLGIRNEELGIRN